MTNTTKFTWSDVAAEAVACFDRYGMSRSDDFDGWSLLPEVPGVRLEATAMIINFREEVCVEVYRFDGSSRMQIVLPWARFRDAEGDRNPDATFLDEVDEAVLDAVRIIRRAEDQARSGG